MNLGILGCGDFLRWQEETLKASRKVQVKAVYDPNRERAESWAERLDAKAAASEDEILTDPEIDLVSLFVPPWLRQDLFLRAADHGKHLLPTKPLGHNAAACDAMVDAVVRNKVRCGVIYRSAGNPWFDTVKSLLEEGRYGKLALFRQDWIHHYPQWADWALDPEKNGGPFMDAMIHNLNIARYFMARPMRTATWFSDKLAHSDLPCADTESLRVDFEGGGVAQLFITWAADLAVHSTEGNFREHIDLLYLVTDQGWHITEGDPRRRGFRPGVAPGRRRVDRAPAAARHPLRPLRRGRRERVSESPGPARRGECRRGRAADPLLRRAGLWSPRPGRTLIGLTEGRPS